MTIVQGRSLDTYDEGHQLQPLLPHRNEIIDGFLSFLLIVSYALYIVLILLSAGVSPNE